MFLTVQNKFKISGARGEHSATGELPLVCLSRRQLNWLQDMPHLCWRHTVIVPQWTCVKVANVI